MSKRSEAVKDWRKRTKERMVVAMGGSCVCCGYEGCIAVFRFHHLDKNAKEYSFGSARADIKSWARMVDELRKCVLVCSNCHLEIHHGNREVPENAVRFSEEFTDYKVMESVDRFNKCPICGKKKSIRLITCSKECASRRSWHVDWAKVDLGKLLMTRSILSIADELGISDASVRKRAIKLGLR